MPKHLYQSIYQLFIWLTYLYLALSWASDMTKGLISRTEPSRVSSRIAVMLDALDVSAKGEGL